MQTALDLFAELTDPEVGWLLGCGVERQVISSTRLITEGERPDAVWFVLEGLVEVTIAALPGQAIARLGPGEIFGEIAFVEQAAASATVAALENSLLLEVPAAMLADQLAGDDGFAMRFYRALTLIQSRRLRATTQRSLAADQTQEGVSESAVWRALVQRIDELKTAAVDAQREAARNGDVLPDASAEALLAGFSAFAMELNEHIGDDSGLPESERSVLGNRVRREVLPFVLQSELGDRIYMKPRGYAGDYLTIHVMYSDKVSGTGRLGPVFDRAFREQPANLAVMNRRGLLAEEIGRTLAERSNGEQVHVTSLASGPAAELFDVFGTLDDKKRLKATCIDIDFQALGFVSDRAGREQLSGSFDLHNGNLVYLAIGRKKLDLPPQDLIYSIGLIDYFADKFVKKLLDWIHDKLRPGGRVVLGNFHPRNPSKALMDYVLDWRLIHRTEDDMNRLFEASKFGRPCTNIRFEPSGVNLFAECVKAN